MTSITITPPAAVRTPRGAPFAAYLFLGLLGWAERMASSRRQKLATADRQTEAARVRRLATQMMAQDPRYAADLFAAADRHERQA